METVRMAADLCKVLRQGHALACEAHALNGRDDVRLSKEGALTVK